MMAQLQQLATMHAQGVLRTRSSPRRRRRRWGTGSAAGLSAERDQARRTVAHPPVRWTRDFLPALDHWSHVYSGKVRDLYVPEGATGLDDTDAVLVVASDRVSAFDHVLEPGIPGKGELLTTLSLWWFDQLDDVPNHLIPDHRLDGDTRGGAHPGCGGRALHAGEAARHVPDRVRRARLPDRQRLGRVPAHRRACAASRCRPGSPTATACRSRSTRPRGRRRSAQHDENISFERTVELVGAEVAEELRRLSLHVYARGAAIAEKRGVIIADTKFEFGADRGDRRDHARRRGAHQRLEPVLGCGGVRRGQRPRTSGWPASTSRSCATGCAANWDKTGTPPELPADIVERTAARYRELLERLDRRVTPAAAAGAATLGASRGIARVRASVVVRSVVTELLARRHPPWAPSPSASPTSTR